MKKAELVSGLVLLAFGILLWLVLIPWQIAEAPMAIISPRMMPLLCAAILVILSLVLIGQSLLALRQLRDDSGPIFTRGEVIATLGVVVLFSVATLLFVYTGPLLPGLMIIILPMLALGERRIAMLTLLPAGLMGGAWLLFYVVLGTSFQ
ncbi:tripartite tricarboxylate transporter TctB family protein [Martelella mediterranea]|uniref:Tripartite tricarboxylate transporter TctB family protein n=1 Tax=Martelella mediterranea DSM 17316 TaxID=1122214 RepID=A0A1U9Z0H7_9HYPH|nr:tripartite tricarboxylate transporter TctB family protein [Martelella mediterranea]AQZ51201.1 Tripartite tricarboxylate transporter TctB family protein [Martelella mediterranea DSM 17316]